jgi:chalcone isomerase
MIKHVFIFEPRMNPIEADRYYFRFHSKEAVRAVGPWLRRYETYRAWNAPAQADKFGIRRGRLSELWYENLEAFAEAKVYSRPYTVPEGGWKAFFGTNGAVTIVPAMPTEDFLGKAPTPEERPFIRWCQIFKYPDGVSASEGENWYLKVHAKETSELPGLLRFVSHRAPENSVFPNPWHRMSELWFEDFAAWLKAIVDPPPRLTAPPWGGTLPFVDMVSTFVPYKPDVDFLRDNPLIP